MAANALGWAFPQSGRRRGSFPPPDGVTARLQLACSDTDGPRRARTRYGTGVLVLSTMSSAEGEPTTESLIADATGGGDKAPSPLVIVGAAFVAGIALAR